MSQTIVQDWKSWNMYDDIVSAIENVQGSLNEPTKKIVLEKQNMVEQQRSFDSDESPFFAIGGTTAYQKNTQKQYDNIEEETMACMEAVQGI